MGMLIEKWQRAHGNPDGTRQPGGPKKKPVKPKRHRGGSHALRYVLEAKKVVGTVCAGDGTTTTLLEFKKGACAAWEGT